MKMMEEEKAKGRDSEDERQEEGMYEVEDGVKRKREEREQERFPS